MSLCRHRIPGCRSKADDTYRVIMPRLCKWSSIDASGGVVNIVPNILDMPDYMAPARLWLRLLYPLKHYYQFTLSFLSCFITLASDCVKG